MICFFSCFMFLTTRVTFSRGTIHVLCAMVQRSGYSTCGYHGWSPWRTCNSFSVMGRGSTQEPPCRQLAICNFRCAVVAICRGRSRFSSDGTVTSNKDVEWLPSHGFSLLIIQPLLSGLIEVFFARTMRSTSEFAKIFLSKCVCFYVWYISSMDGGCYCSQVLPAPLAARNRAVREVPRCGGTAKGRKCRAWSGPRRRRWGWWHLLKSPIQCFQIWVNHGKSW